MADVLVKFDQARYNSQLASVQRIGEYILQPLVDQFNALGVGDLAPNELNSLFNSPVDLVFDKMTNGNPVNIAGVNVIKSKAIDLLVKPNGYEAFLQSVAQTKESLRESPYHGSGIQNILAHQIANWFETDEDGQVSVTSAMNEKLEAQNKHYAKTDAAKTMFQFAQDLAALMNNSDVVRAGSGQNMTGSLRSLCVKYNENAKEIEVDADAVLWYNGNNVLYKNPALE